MTSEPKEMEVILTLHRGLDLKKSKAQKLLKKVKKKPYALVSVEDHPDKLTTWTDEKNASNPVWEYRLKLVFQTPVPDVTVQKAVVFEIKHESSTFDTSMGKVRIPLKDLLSRDRKEVSYAVRLSDKLVKGEIFISHKRNIIQRGDCGENVPSIKISDDPPPPPGPSRGLLETVKGFATCIMVVNGIATIVSELN